MRMEALTIRPHTDILKYEYLTQLLLDSNYLPLVLKLFAHQDVDRAIDQRNDREDLKYVCISKVSEYIC